MHNEAFAFVADHASDVALTAVEVGGRNVNGHVRGLFPNAKWYVIDAQPGPDVDEVANGATWVPPAPVDLVVCTEVFEHTPHWRAILENIHKMLRPGGQVILTMAGPGRAPHGVMEDSPDQWGWYQNIDPQELDLVLSLAGFRDIVVDQAGEDVRAHAFA